jgi:hypothetical protein
MDLLKQIVRFGAIVVIVLLVIAGLSLFLALPFMWIWNYAVVAAISGTNEIGYWVAFWLMLFISLFVAGSRGSSK